MKDKYSKMKKNLIHIRDNLYIHPSDPLYHEKLLKYVNPNNAESHYYLAAKYDRIGRKKKAIFHYEKAIQLGSEHSEVAEVNLALLQQPEVRKIQGQAKEKTTRVSPLSKSIIITLLLLNIVLIFLLFQFTGGGSLADGGLPFIDKEDEQTTFQLPAEQNVEALEIALYEEVLKRAEQTNEDKFTVIGYKDDAEIMTATYDSGHIPYVTISYTNEEMQHLKLEAMKHNVVATNMVRTALQAYINENNSPPEDLNALVSDYPNNYISSIPNEYFSESNRISDSFSREGGWVYDPNSPTIEKMFYPNVANQNTVLPYMVNITIPYEPMKIVISKEDHKLYLMNGKIIIDEKIIGLGKNNKTPNGEFQVLERVLDPVGKRENMFGAAGLGLGEIAIHGTYNQDSIGANKSGGCIRMNNEDILKIFPLVPKGTIVSIVPDSLELESPTLLSNYNFFIESPLALINETTETMFTWLD